MATTTVSPPRRQRPSYGIDAPGLVQGFFVGGTIALGVALAAGRWLSPVVAAAAGVAACYGLGMGGYMLWGSLVGKVRDRHRLLDLLPWAGDEAVLDVGCGRGLMLVAAARRVPAGRAVGIDVWQAADQSGNRPEAALANAHAEGVADRVAVETADARRLPFAAATFDAVVSHWVVHNLPTPADRAAAVAEMARVLKPGGRVLVADIACHAEYLAALDRLGFADVRRVSSRAGDAVRGAVSFGSFRPGAVVGRKPGR